MTDTKAAFSGFDIQDVFEITLRRWRWLVLGAVLGLIGGLALWWALPRRYEATTTILVEPQGVPESYVRSTITLEVDQRIRTLSQRVASHANLNELIEAIGPERLDPSGNRLREELMGEIRGGLSVSVDSGDDARRKNPASIVELRYEGPVAEVVADVVTELANLFITENRKDRARQAASTAEFLETELLRVRSEVTLQEKRIGDFQMEHLGALPSQLDANNQELDRLNVALTANLESQERMAQESSLLRGRPGEEGGTVTSESSVGAALAEARKQLIDARRIYTDDHPNVLSLHAQIEQLERELEEEAKQVEAGGKPEWIDPARQRELEAIALNLATRKSEERNLRNRIAELQRRVEETPKNEQRLLELTRDYDTMKETYKLLLGNKHDAALALNLEEAQMAEQFKLLRPASVPGAPSWPDPLVVVPAGLGVGLGLAALLILWVEIRTPAFHSVDTLARRLGLPIFAAIPDLDRERIYEGLPAPDPLDWRLVVPCAPNSAAAEQYRGFAPHFLEKQPCRVILVTSAHPGDGKSVSCANLAWLLSSDVGRRVLLIDADMRRATQHRLLGIPREPGLSEVLRGQVDLGHCVRLVSPNLSCLPAGAAVANPFALLTGESLLKLCEQASESYEVVMIDSPPILPVIDGKILRRLADMVIFVVRAGVSPSGGVVRSLRELKDVAGVVFNRVSAGAFRRYYYYDAYSYYEPQEPRPPAEVGGQPSLISRLRARSRKST